MARLKAADFDDKREALLEAATRVFARLGYDGAPMTAIAKEAGVSKALLYHYYSSKNALLYAALDHHLTRLRDCAREADDATLPPHDHLRRLISALLFAYRDADQHHKVQINDLDKLPAAEQRRLKGVEREIVAIFSHAVLRVAPHLTTAQLKPSVMALFGVMNWSYLWFRDDQPMSRADYSALVADLFCGGVGALKAPRPAKGAPLIARRNRA